jgi:Na+/H+ antiporter NhaD/arsenite permease-like protein
MKIDRPGAAIIGAVLMVAFGIVGAQEALASIDFSTIVLLFSMMLVVANLRVAGFFERLAERLIARLQPHHLLPTVIATCGLLSAVLVNDIVCLARDSGLGTRDSGFGVRDSGFACRAEAAPRRWRGPAERP